MISALCWVKKGAALSTPEKFQLSDEEYERIQKEMGVQLQDAKLELNDFQETMKVEDSDTEEMAIQDTNEKDNNEESPKEPGDLSIYNLDNYDDEETFDAEQEPVAAPMFSNIRGLSYYENSSDDPYIKLNEEEEEEERNELIIEETDNLILACKTEDDVSYLEVYVYEEEEDNLYVHHDIMLPSFPLCLEWIDFPMGRKLGNETRPNGNYIAIGTFDPQVEIWDLDVVDAVFPEVILGQIPSSNAGIKSGKSKHGPARVAKRPQAERHVDAVMSISANKNVRNLIATGSADTTIKLWDLKNPLTAISSYTHHKNKVQSVVWNPQESSVILSGGYDKMAAIFDSRAPDSVVKFNLTADVECLKWDPFKPEIFYVSTEDGIVKAFDARNATGNSLFTLQAHDSAVSALDINQSIPGCMITGSGDKTVKVWSIEDHKPKCLLSKDLNAGKVFSTNFCSDSLATVAIAGSRGKVIVWNLESNTYFRKGFPNRQFGTHQSNRKEVTEMESDAELDEEDEIDEDMESGDEV